MQELLTGAIEALTILFAVHTAIHFVAGLPMPRLKPSPGQLEIDFNAPLHTFIPNPSPTEYSNVDRALVDAHTDYIQRHWAMLKASDTIVLFQRPVRHSQRFSPDGMSVHQLRRHRSEDCWRCSVEQSNGDRLIDSTLQIRLKHGAGD